MDRSIRKIYFLPVRAHLLQSLTAATWSNASTGSGATRVLPREANISNSTGTRKFALLPRRSIRRRGETSMRREGTLSVGLEHSLSHSPTNCSSRSRNGGFSRKVNGSLSLTVLVFEHVHGPLRRTFSGGSSLPRAFEGLGAMRCGTHAL